MNTVSIFNFNDGTSYIQPVMNSWNDFDKVKFAFTPDMKSLNMSYLKKLKKETKSEVCLSGTIIGPDGLLSAFLGDGKTIYSLYDDRENVDKFLDYFASIIIKVGQKLFTEGLDMLRIGEASVSQLSPELYDSVVKPYHKNIFKEFSSVGGIPDLHVCGRCNSLIESFKKVGTVVIETLTPPPLGDITLKSAKTRVGDGVCLKGNLDPVNVVKELTLSEVALATRKCLEIGSKGSGFILSVADCLAPGTPRENIAAIAEEVHNFKV